MQIVILNFITPACIFACSYHANAFGLHYNWIWWWNEWQHWQCWWFMLSL